MDLHSMMLRSRNLLSKVKKHFSTTKFNSKAAVEAPTFQNFFENNIDETVSPILRDLFENDTDEGNSSFSQDSLESTKTDKYTSLNSEIKRFISAKQYQKMPADIQEYLQKIKGKDLKDTQLLYLSKIPWGSSEVTNMSITEARDILNRTHSGMLDVKERILRYIACQKRVGTNYGGILLLVGPPGVGKTSIASAVAEAMGRKFVKISLAGASDADFLRGTSSIYSDSKPGRIIDAIIKAENFAPLILLDEIDKMGASTQHGNPEHALLDILDSDRSNFIDDFLGIPINLSAVVFIATANSTNSISPILLDRLEVIILSGYTKKEKLDIMTQHLIPKLRKEYLLTEDDLKISLPSAEYIIDTFTNEPGIRSLEQLLRRIFESIVYYIQIGTPYSVPLTVSDINIMLGKSEIRKSKRGNKTTQKNHSTNNIKKRDDIYY